MFAHRVIALWEFLWDKLSRFFAFLLVKCLQLAPFVLGGGSVILLLRAFQPLREELLSGEDRWWLVASSWALSCSAIFLLYAVLRLVHQFSNGGVTLLTGLLTRRKLTERGFDAFTVVLWVWWGTVALVLSLAGTWQLESGMMTFVSLLIFNLAGAPLAQLEKGEEWKLESREDEVDSHSGKVLHRARVGEVEPRIEALRARFKARMAATTPSSARASEPFEDDSEDFDELWAKTEARRADEDEPEGDADWSKLPR